jgi:hypothetical protein
MNVAPSEVPCMQKIQALIIIHRYLLYDFTHVLEQSSQKCVKFMFFPLFRGFLHEIIVIFYDFSSFSRSFCGEKLCRNFFDVFWIPTAMSTHQKKKEIAPQQLSAWAMISCWGLNFSRLLFTRPCKQSQISTKNLCFDIFGNVDQNLWNTG